MRVTTIDGGFRGRRGGLRSVRSSGIGNLSSSQQNSEADAFNARFARFDQMDSLLRHSLTTGVLPLSDAMQLQASFIALGAERDTHLARLSTLQNDADVLEWRSTADDIAARAATLADRTGILLGAEPEVRGWQIGVVLLGGALAFGGLAYWMSRQGRRRKR